MNSMPFRFVLGFAILFVPWSAVIALRELGPITYEPLSGLFLFFLSTFLLASLLAYIFGFILLAGRASPVFQREPSNEIGVVRRRFFSLLYVFSLAFFVLSLLDFLVIKGATFSEIVALRELENIAGPRNSLIGAVIALLSGAPPLLFAISLLQADISQRDRIAINCTVAMGFFAMFLSGGRNPFFIGLLFILVFRYFFASGRPLFNVDGRRTFFILGIVAITSAIGYSMYLFIERAAFSGVALDEMISVFSLNYGLTITSFETENELLRSLYTIYVFLTFYITHALNYISDYFAGEYSPALMGAYTLPQLTCLVDVVLGTAFFSNSREALLVNGAYLSLPGSLYLDFGMAGATTVGGVVSFVFGALIAKPTQIRLIGKVVLAYLVVAFLFSPIYGVFGMANGFSMIFLFFFVIGIVASHGFATKIRTAGKRKDFDYIIGLSNGIDSSCLTYVAKELMGLRPLLFHVDAGWNTNQAVGNIEKLVDGLQLDLYTEVIDWEEMKDLQLAFLRSQIPDQDFPQDQAL